MSDVEARIEGFINANACKEHDKIDMALNESQIVYHLLKELCNLKEQVRMLESRLESTGIERIGGGNYGIY